jgi:uncharacterized protein (TIGR02246 family)
MAVRRLAAEDQLAIAELLARYNHAVDDGDPDGVAACFMEDGLLNGRSGHYRGKEELLRIGKHTTAEMKLRHVVSNTVIDAQADSSIANVRSHLLFYRVTDAGLSFEASGIYNDVVVKVDGEWKFQSRLMTPSMGGAWPGQAL